MVTDVGECVWFARPSAYVTYNHKHMFVKPVLVTLVSKINALFNVFRLFSVVQPPDWLLYVFSVAQLPGLHVLCKSTAR